MSDLESNPRISYTFNLPTDDSQLYIHDAKAPNNWPDNWVEQLDTRMIAVAPGIVGIGIAQDGRVPIRIDLFDRQPDDTPLISWDHVVEASIEIASGQTVIAGCTDYLPEITRQSVAPGIYRIRIYFGELGSISKNGLGREDHYHVVIWPEEEYRSPEILKKWPSL